MAPKAKADKNATQVKIPSLEDFVKAGGDEAKYDEFVAEQKAEKAESPDPSEAEIKAAERKAAKEEKDADQKKAIGHADDVIASIKEWAEEADLDKIDFDQQVVAPLKAMVARRLQGPPPAAMERKRYKATADATFWHRGQSGKVVKDQILDTVHHEPGTIERMKGQGVQLEEMPPLEDE